MPPTRASRDQPSQGKRRCGARPGRKALGRLAARGLAERASSQPPWSLSGGAGTAVCYPTLEKTLQGGGRELKAFSIIQQSELPAAPVGDRGRPARAPGLGLAGLGGGLVVGGTDSLDLGRSPHGPTPARPAPALSAGRGGGGSRAWQAGLELSPALQTQTVLWNGGSGLARFPEPRWGVRGKPGRKGMSAVRRRGPGSLAGTCVLGNLSSPPVSQTRGALSHPRTCWPSCSLWLERASLSGLSYRALLRHHLLREALPDFHWGRRLCSAPRASPCDSHPQCLLCSVVTMCPLTW